MNNIYLSTLQISLLVIGIIIALMLLIIAFYFISKNSKKKSSSILANKIITLLGGKDNILSLSSKGSRLIVSLKNKDLLNENELKQIGVSSIINMSNKTILVIGEISKEIETLFNQNTK